MHVYLEEAYSNFFTAALYENIDQNQGYKRFSKNIATYYMVQNVCCACLEVRCFDVAASQDWNIIPVKIIPSYSTVLHHRWRFKPHLSIILIQRVYEERCIIDDDWSLDNLSRDDWSRNDWSTQRSSELGFVSARTMSLAFQQSHSDHDVSRAWATILYILTIMIFLWVVPRFLPSKIPRIFWESNIKIISKGIVWQLPQTCHVYTQVLTL